MSAIFKREFKAYFSNPLGFIILALVYAFLGIRFGVIYEAGAPMVEYVVLNASQLLIFIVPVITMRLFSDERRTKTDQVLFTAPVKLINIVLGKFFAALALYALCFAPTVIYQIIVSSYVSVNAFYYIYSIIGILLFGMALIALGMFISSLTESPITSIIFTLVANLFLLSGTFINMITIPDKANNFFETIKIFLLNTLVKLLEGMNFMSTLESFLNQSFAVKDIIYFISISVAFIFLTERSLEKRRWS